MSEVPADAFEAYRGPDRLEEARAVAGPEPAAERPEAETTYRVHCGAFLYVHELRDADEAQAVSRAGMTVTAVTEGQR